MCFLFFVGWFAALIPVRKGLSGGSFIWRHKRLGAKQAPRPRAHGRRAAARRVRRQAFARASRAAAANPACSPCRLCPEAIQLIEFT
ncbi:hypothetical protein DIJ63_31495 [Burkholderia pseudomallei]|nr:hypothetical protein DIJ63_31495 [Burkholderia pseudomallei]